MTKTFDRPLIISVAVLIAIGGLSACEASPPGATPSTTTGTRSALPSPSAGPGATSSPPTPTPTVKASPAAVTYPLGPLGYGKLKLGMTAAQAGATNLITMNGRTDDCGIQADLNGSPGYSGAVYYGSVWISSTRGVVAIYAYPGVRTPEGVGIGTSYQALKAAYPSWRSVTDEGPDGRGLVTVPGNSAAEYRIVVLNGRVRDLAIQTKIGHCYE